MISANESLSSTMKNEASKRSLKGRGMVREKKEVELNECFKRKGSSEGRCSAIEGKVVFVVWFET